MRLDYALYGLAVILFALTAVTYVWVADETYKVFYEVSTTIVGIISLIGGYFLRPKAEAVKVQPKSEPEKPQIDSKSIDSKPTQPVGGVIVEAQTTQMQVAEAPKVEVPAVKPPPTVVPFAQSPKPESVAAPVVETSPQAEAKRSEFSRIRGISQSRISQLKTVGINSVADLANASPEGLAAMLNVSPKIVKMWIGSAKKIAK